MNEDLSDLMSKLNSMLGSDSANELGNIINNISSGNSNNNSNNSNDNSSESNNSDSSSSNNFSDDESNNFNIDFNTIMKMKSMMDAMNTKKNDPRAKLLMSLKPYLKDSRKQKLDQYIQLLNMSSVFELFKENGGDSNSNK